jgi:hypothetical protein
MMLRPRRQPAKAQRPQLAAYRVLADRQTELLLEPQGEVLPAPAHDAVDRRDRSVLDNRRQRPAMRVGEPGRGARRLAVDQTFGAARIEPQYPVAHCLQTDAADPCRVRPSATIVYLGQRQQPAALRGILRRFRQHAKVRPIKIVAKPYRCCHGEPHARFA